MKTLLHRSINKRGKQSLKPTLRTMLLALSCCVAVVPAYAQLISDDENAEDTALDDTSVAGIIADDDQSLSERTFSRQLSVSPVGGVDQGTTIDEGDPYAAEGIRLGNFIIRPSIEIGISGNRSESNSDQGAPAGIVTTKSDVISNQNALQVLVNSDWSRHAFQAQINGTLPLSISGDVDNPTFSAASELRLDIGTSTTLTLNGELSAENEDPQSAAFTAAVDPILNPGLFGTNEPTTLAYGGGATLAHDFGGVFTEISGAIRRLEFGAASLNDGTSVSQSDLNFTDVDLTLRGGYALSGVLSPFVQVNYGKRLVDADLDFDGVNRDATRYGVQVGALIDMGEKLNGEVAIGYAAQELDDASFERVDAFTLATNLNWSPMRGTDVAWTASTQFAPSGDQAVSGSTVYATDLGLSHRLRSNLTATASLGATLEDFSGPVADQKTLRGQIGFLYNINRYMGLTGRLSYQRTFSSDAEERDKNANAFLGIRLQR